MAKINLGRVILGGLLAGLVLNIGEFLLHEKVVKAKETLAMAALGKSGAMGQLWVWLVYGFVVGIVIVWLYAAIRPRFGAGPGTAACAGLTAWFLSTCLGAVAMVNLGLQPTDLVVTTTLWALVETVVAAVVGCWLYQEA